MLSNLKGYYRPQSIPSALALLEKNSGSILVLAGGTKLILNENNIVKELVDITSLGLDYIKEGSGEIRIGATTPIQQIVENRILGNAAGGIISRAAHLTSHSIMVRNTSTVGGELVTSGPLSLFYCTMLVLQAQVRIAGGEEFALAMNVFLDKKGLGGGLLIEVVIPKLPAHSYAAVAPILSDMDRPIICAAGRVTFKKGLCQKAKLAITGTPRVPQRLHRIEEFLEGKPLDGSSIADAMEMAEAVYEPISDSFASEEYRKAVAPSLIKRVLYDCLEQAQDMSGTSE